MTRLLIECTFVFEHPHDNSGIQRVVRNVIKNLPNTFQEVECVPVVLLDGQVYRVLSLSPITYPPTIERLRRMQIRLEHWQHRYWALHAHIERLWPFSRWRNARRTLFVLSKLASLAITLPRKASAYALQDAPELQRVAKLDIQAGDQLVLLDSSWHANFFAIAERLKKAGVGIISVIYDLIPLTNPEFCDAGLVRVFERWFDWIAVTADGFMAISTTIQDQVRQELAKRLGEQEAQKRWFDHFYLGSDLDLADNGKPVDPALLRVFADESPVYLMVSTIEPRKNHRYLLDAFDQLWRKRVNVKLCIIGKIGWKCEALVARIRRHPELNKRLFMFNQLDDQGLEYAYRKSKSLVFPSFVEGFGLPLVEAMQRGLPVMTSDIPVFREVCGDHAAYFDLQRPETLAQLIQTYEGDGHFPATKNLTDWSWFSWSTASVRFIERVIHGVRFQPPAATAEKSDAQHADCA